MNYDKERKSFEQWVRVCGLNISSEEGLYRSHVVGWMWKAWQAGRAALLTPSFVKGFCLGKRYGIESMEDIDLYTVQMPSNAVGKRHE